MASGRIPLRIGEARDGFLYVPEGVSPARPAPLVVFFHGSGGDSLQAEMIREAADHRHALVLSVDSRGRTWDVIEGELGPDVAFLSRALSWTRERYAIDSAHVAVAGFSDGASYALTLGLSSGGLFTHVLAFSPGFFASAQKRLPPRVFISHGVDDRVLPIESCSRMIVRKLRREGYDVEYRELAAGHVVPPAITAEAFDWMFR